MTRGFDRVVVANWPRQNSTNPLHAPVAALCSTVVAGRGIWISATEVAEPPGVPVHQVSPAPPDIRHGYDRHSGSAIWPTYHDAIEQPEFQPDWSASYRQANSRVADAAARLAATSAAVWCYGHDLQLVPGLLRALRPDLCIGFVLPIPFPPVELFIRMPCREEIMGGLLGADTIAVQTPGDAANLLRVAHHLFGLPTNGNRLLIPDESNRKVTVMVSPESVDVGRIRQHAAQPAIRAQARVLRDQLGRPKQLLLGIDPLDHTAGIERRLTAIEQLLVERRLRPSHTAVVQIALPPQHRARSEEDLRRRIERLVARINGDHGKVGRPAVHYLHRPVSGADLLALLLAADVLLATPLRDGMNLIAKQYLAARLDNTGALILSEFSGAAPELRTAHLVNPYDLDELKATILHAGNEQSDHARTRIQTMRQHLESHDEPAWARRLLSTSDANGHAARAATSLISLTAATERG